MTFAKLTYREQPSRHRKLYRIGFHGRVARSTLAAANESPDCLSLFPWAGFRRNMAAVKMRTLHDLLTTNGAERVTLSRIRCATAERLWSNIPTFIGITDSKVHDEFAMQSFFAQCQGGVNANRPKRRLPAGENSDAGHYKESRQQGFGIARTDAVEYGRQHTAGAESHQGSGECARRAETKSSHEHR
jgi:hypothetical protein